MTQATLSETREKSLLSHVDTPAGSQPSKKFDTLSSSPGPAFLCLGAWDREKGRMPDLGFHHSLAQAEGALYIPSLVYKGRGVDENAARISQLPIALKSYPRQSAHKAGRLMLASFLVSGALQGL